MSHTIDTTRKDFSVYKMGFLYAIACTTFQDDAALIAMNQRYPSGTSGGWKISPDANPVPCDLVADRRHVLFEVSS